MEKEPIYADFYNEVPTITEESSDGSASMFPPATMAYEDFLRLTKKLKKKNKKLKEKDKKRKKKEKKRKKKESKKLKKMYKHIAELENAYTCRISESKPSDRFDWLKQIAVECTPMLMEYALLDKTSKKHDQKHKKKGVSKYKVYPGNVIDVPEGQYTVMDTVNYPSGRLVEKSNKRN